jgi:hypothetical protein
MNSNLIKERIEEFAKKDDRVNEDILNEITLYIYATSFPDNDIFFLAKKFKHDVLFDLISYADGEPIILPDKMEFRNNYLVAICFYMKEVLDMTWTEIKEVLNLPEKDKDLISSISIGKKINKLKEKFSYDIQKLLKQIKITDIRDIVKEKEQLDERIRKDK